MSPSSDKEQRRLEIAEAEPRGYASPPCYQHELDPNYLGTSGGEDERQANAECLWRRANTTNEIADILVHQAPDAIILADTGGVIRLWNAASTRIFGFTEDQAIGESLDLIIPERFREAHWRGFDRALQDHVTKYVGQALATRSVRSDGVQIYVELSFAIILDDAEKVLGVVSHARDITKRFERDRANRKRLQELEAEAVIIKRDGGPAHARRS